MVIQESENKVKDIGFDDTIGFEIDKEDQAKLFKMLSTSVYVDKAGSIVREYVSNCVDAQVVVGKPNDPVYIEYNDGVISFIDNGRGMSPEIINKVYKKLGKSDKVNDANLIGGWGELSTPL